MKQVYLSFFALVFALFISANVFAHDIEVKNADGVTIYYKWINDSTELAVSYRTISTSSGSYYIFHDYTDNVVIPESVTYNDVIYNVTSIDADAFKSCSGLTSVEIPDNISNSNELHIINAQNFPDEKFREYLLDEPYGKDGVLTEEEISGITTLNVSNMGISDLKGIEYFTALQKLLCYKNNLTCLNLSANKQLNEVDCYSNQIMGIKMDSLLASLPTLSEGEGSLYVLDATDEGNICFTEQVSYAKSKGWIVYHYTGSDWQEYEGRESGIIINEDNFPDEEFRAFLIKQDYGKDLIITGDELTTIVSIDTQSYNYAWTASNGNIRTLKGIEYFTYLRYLNIAGNKIESLDISKNRQLQELDCTYNYLTELDVSQNTELTKLYCSGSFSKLDVSKNTKLTTLSFASMKLTEIDLSNNTALTDLSFDVTGLQSVDLSKNVALTKLSCIQNSSLTNLDVSKNKALTYLRCSESKLSTIDISKNTALTYLFCAYNQLTSLDVSKNGELTELACMGNQLTKLDVSKNLKLKTLKCQQNKINGERMYQLIESLPIQTSATLCVINLQVADENICTKDQVKKANEKGWKVMWGYEYYNSGPAGYHPHYYDYEGSDPSGIQGITLENNPNAPVYDLNGRRLTEPAKGINIIGGKKVLNYKR